MITAVCHHCSKRYTLDDNFAGQKVKCRTCKRAFDVPMEGPLRAAPKAAKPGKTTTSLTKAAADPPPDDGAAAAADEASDEAAVTLGEEEVLEMRTQFKTKAEMATMTEDAPDVVRCAACQAANSVGTKRCVRCGKKLEGGKGSDDGDADEGAPKLGTRRLDRPGRGRRKSWLWFFVKSGFLLLLLAAAGVGVLWLLYPRNIEAKFALTKSFFGTDLPAYFSQLVTLDPELEKAPPKPAEPAEPPKPAGPPAGTRVKISGQVVAVEPGTAGGPATVCRIRIPTGEYRVILASADPALAEIAVVTAPGKGGTVPAIVRGTLAKGMDGKLSQVEGATLERAEAAAIAAAVPFEVEGAAAPPEAPKAPDAPPAPPPATPPAGDPPAPPAPPATGNGR